MQTVKEQYGELVALTQLFLLHEFPKGARVESHPEAYAYFKAYAMKTRQQQRQPAPTQQPKTPPGAVNSVQTPPQPEASPSPTTSTPTPRQPKAPPGPTPPKAKAAPTPSQPKEPPPAKKAPPPPPTNNFTLNPLQSTPAVNLQQFHNLWVELFPSIPLKQPPPSDREAKKLAQQWNKGTEVLIVTADSLPKNHLTFLSNVAKALTDRTWHTKIFSVQQLRSAAEAENPLASSCLRLLLVDSSASQDLPNTTTPTLLLADLDLYLHNVQEKRKLWTELQQRLKT